MLKILLFALIVMENGKMITYLKLPAGNYKLIEVSAPNGYLKDKDGLKFTIGNDTHYSYTTYGAFITVTYKNTPIKGQLKMVNTLTKIKN